MNGKFFKEALKRLKLLGVSSKDIKNFEWYHQPIFHGSGVLDFDDITNLMNTIQKLQEEYGGLVYYATCDTFAPFINLFWITENEEEWAMDVEDLKENVVFAYVMNTSQSEFSEFGSIQVENTNGILERVA